MKKGVVENRREYPVLFRATRVLKELITYNALFLPQKRNAQIKKSPFRPALSILSLYLYQAFNNSILNQSGYVFRLGFG